ncbi:hypothetical protein BD410DRAFT_893191 [Rickenella mellea]|uniref:DUF6593 domain-containing protein n=1 Tax=Rickenella mellea TaxID=50990 RepID=A0A4R5XHS6_9AGAM|nr:hypothetical protein BD410DRAFT_893191 [Rickenella mellea]
MSFGRGSVHGNPYRQGGWSGINPWSPWPSPSPSPAPSLPASQSSPHSSVPPTPSSSSNQSLPQTSTSGASASSSVSPPTALLAGTSGFNPAQTAHGVLPLQHPPGLNLGPLLQAGSVAYRFLYRTSRSNFFVADSGNRNVYRVFTDAQTQRTIITNHNGMPIARINWAASRTVPPLVDVRGRTILASEWLSPVSGNVPLRSMRTRGTEYRWQSDGRRFTAWKILASPATSPSGVIGIVNRLQECFEMRLMRQALMVNDELLDDLIVAFVTLEGKLFVGLS